MDYYEELGLSKSASAADIRQAYKQLVRLLHPDHCADGTLRGLAELQMKRLNAILEILTDEDTRAQYDRESLALPIPQGAISRLPKSLPQWIWPATGAAVLLALFVFFRPSHPKSAAPLDVVTAAALPAAPENSLNSQKRRRRTTASRAEQTPEDGPEIGLPQESPLAVPAMAEIRDATVEFPAPRSANVAQSAEPTGRPENPTLAGNWFFMPAARATRSDGLYPPQYIELRVSEHSGVLHGRYRASYRVPDQAISPEVSFAFDGPAGPDGASLPWTGPGGAHGDVTLRLLTSGALEITWVASHLGSEFGLISGTATLVRKVE